MAAAKEARDELTIEDESLVASYMALLQSLSQLRHQLRSAAQNPTKALPFLQPGGNLSGKGKIMCTEVVKQTRKETAQAGEGRVLVPAGAGQL